MALWTNLDAANGTPKYAVAGGLGVSANGSTLYANTQTGAFVANVALGVFGVASEELTSNGNVSSITVSTAGTSATGIPTVTILGSNTVQATATVNVKLTGVTITAAGTGYANDETLTVTGGTSTSAAVITVDTVDASGNITGVSITTVGKYSAVANVTNNPFSTNTSSSGTGFTANLVFGIESVTVNERGQGYESATATASGNGIVGAGLTVTLVGAEGSSKQPLAGWNLRKEGTGGRAGRVHYECLVAMGSITNGDDSDDAQLN